MRLTQDQRRAIANAVLADVPNVDYEAQAQKILDDFVITRLPPPIREVLKNPELAGFISKNERICVEGFYAFPSWKNVNPNEQLGLLPKLRKLATARDAQNQKQRTLRNEVNQAVFSCTTVKQLIERYPELAKYAQHLAPSKTPNLPANKVVEHLKKAGWLSK